MGVKVRVIENGGMVLPAAIRKRLGLEKGGAVIVEVSPEEVTLRSVEQLLGNGRGDLCQICRSAGHVGR